MHYTFNCPSCGFEFKIESEDDGEAAGMLREKFTRHMQEDHPDIPNGKNINSKIKIQMKKLRVKTLERNC